MFESTLEAQHLDEGTRKAAAFSAALAAHVLVVTAAVTASLLWIRPPQGPEPPTPLTAIFANEPPRGDDWRPPHRQPPAPPKGGGEASQPVPAPPETPVQPHATPSKLPAPAEESWLDTSAPGGPGVPYGVERGVPGSTGIGSPDAGGPGGGQGIGAPLTLGAGIVPPVLLVRVEPDYPVAARLGRLPGHVEIEAVVGTDGSVETLRIVSSTSPLFDDAALDAVKRWRYTPARMNGRPVRVVFKFSVDFVLR